MIKWYKDLYLDDNIGKKARKYRNRIEKGKLLPGVFCIIRALNENNLFDIINANELLFPYYQRKEILVLGLAPNRESAMYLVKDMLEEMYDRTGVFCPDEYYGFQKKQSMSDA